MLYGGSRSGKSLIILRSIFLRAMKKPSRHLLVRFRFNAARISLAHETVPFVIANCFPNFPITWNKSDNYWTVKLPNGQESQVWLGGTDDKERIEKLLGNEYSSIYANECSQIPFAAIPMLWTRLAENVGLKQRFFYDCNPPGKKHWTHQLFMEGKLPDGEVWAETADSAHLRMNPKDNLKHLSPEYLKTLEGLPRRMRERFLDGRYLDDVEGALWSDLMISAAKAKPPGSPRKRVIAVDPAVTNNPGSDDCGIMVCALDENREGIVEADLTLKASTRTWAQRVVSAYHARRANEVVAEVNQGGDLVEDAIRNIDPSVKVVKVRATVGKFARAEPVSMLYEQGKVAHVADLPELESELTETVFDENLRASPNRLDALVWGLSHLMIGKTGVRINVGSI